MDTDPIGRLEARHPPIDLFDDYRGRHIRPDVTARHRAPVPPRDASGPLAVVGTVLMVAGTALGGAVVIDAWHRTPVAVAPAAPQGGDREPRQPTIPPITDPFPPGPAPTLENRAMVPVALTTPIRPPTAATAAHPAVRQYIHPLGTPTRTPTTVRVVDADADSAPAPCPDTTTSAPKDGLEPKAVPDTPPPVDPPRSPRADERADGPKAGLRQDSRPVASTTDTATDANVHMISSSAPAPKISSVPDNSQFSDDDQNVTDNIGSNSTAEAAANAR